MPNANNRCLHCERNSEEVPLIAIEFRGQEVFICPQDLPILIHKPARLADKLPGAENLKASEEHHH